MLIGWVFFRAETLPAAATYLRALTGLAATAAATPLPALTDPRTMTAMLLGTGLAFAPLLIGREPSHEWTVADGTPGAAGRILLRTAATMTLIGLSTLPLLLGGFNPFIYFRF